MAFGTGVIADLERSYQATRAPQVCTALSLPWGSTSRFVKIREIVVILSAVSDPA